MFFTQGKAEVKMTQFHNDDHKIIHLPINRRSLLLSAGLGIGLSMIEGLTANAVAKGVNLPGFSAFSDSVKVYKNSKYYLIESNGIPTHTMMVGIKSWQQQIPVPQPYFGGNAWSLPITPKLSKAPISNKGNFLRGAIGIAVNGIPIFNALNNRGDDAFLAGELDNFGGHCGQADDYHYHAAPFHLQNVVGFKSPIAYALDGFPLFGEKEPDGSPIKPLDSFNGHTYGKFGYHYHGTNTYPYINGGFMGVVNQLDGQVNPQATTYPFRPPQRPLQGAEIESCENLGNNHFKLKYKLGNDEITLDYRATLTSVEISSSSSTGTSTSEVFQRRNSR